MKPKYVKPVAMDMGSLKPVHGADCSSGFAAGGVCATTGHRPDDGCGTGNDPDLQPLCEATGNVATGNCEGSGNATNKICYANGGTAGWGCIAAS